MPKRNKYGSITNSQDILPKLPGQSSRSRSEIRKTDPFSSEKQSLRNSNDFDVSRFDAYKTGNLRAN